VKVLQRNTPTPFLSIVIPVFNEEKRIGKSLDVITEYLQRQSYSYELLLVDDGSTDRTFDICQVFANKHEWARVIRHSKNHGKGCAVRTGVLNVSGEYVLVCDADLATPIEELNKFWNYLEDGADIVIASRPLRESRLIRRQPWYRELAGRAFNLVVRLVAVPGIHDTQCGFKLFSRKAIDAVFPLCFINDFGFDIEVLYLALKLGFRIKEVPVCWYHQQGSKVHLIKDGLRMLIDLPKILISHRGVGSYENQ
jgi:dolichyl-phosphate beta-glucosyltransferase